ncbi:MAG TPA: protein kinase [Thermoanaerobaculia bacterium]|nr:protein kinase [Thermoanaerobaculia bacterium]
MPSNDAPLSPGTRLRQYLLIERLGEDQLGSEWTAQDSILGRVVSILILDPRVSSDRDRMELITSEVRAAAHIDRPSIGKVYELDHDGKVHFIVSEFVEGKSLSTELRDVAIDAAPLVHIAIAIAEAIDHAHSQGLVHGNLHARHVLVSSDGRVKVLGFGAGRGGSALEEMQVTAGDLESVGFRSPEGVVGRPIDARSDVFAFGVLLYEMATGARPFTGDTAEEIFDRILHAAPPAPRLINPAVDPAVVSIIGRCIQKDPSRRYAAAGAILVDLRKREATLGRSSKKPEQAPATPREVETGTGVGAALTERETETVASGTAEGLDGGHSARVSVILYAEVPDPDAGADEASKALGARLQELLDETIYLADGKIVDPFARHVIAEFEESFDAVRAARKGLHDLENYNNRQAGRAPTIDARLVVLRGDVETVDGSLRGPAVEMARVASRAIPPGKLAVSAEIISETSTPATGEPLVTVAGRTFFAVSSMPALVQPSPVPSAVPEIAPVPQQQGRFGFRARVIAIGVSVLLVAGLAAAGWIVKRKAAANREAGQIAEVPSAPPVVVPRAPTPITVEEVSVEGAFDTSTVQLAGLVRYGALGLMDSLRDFDATPRPHGNESRFSARLRQGTEGAELVPVRLSPVLREGAPIPLTGQAAVSFANWIAQEMGSSRRFEPTASTALEHFSRSVAGMAGQIERPQPQTIASIRDAIRVDPSFLPAHVLAIDMFERTGDRKAAIEAARRAVELAPDDLHLRRGLARWLYQSGDPAAGVAEFSEVLARDRTDRDALTAAGLYALAVRDETIFRKVLGSLDGTPGPTILHEPDLLLASARFDQAATPYFDLEREQPDNAALALKIGRIAVLRHMNSIAEIEVQKLERLDPSYGLLMLRAYIHAQNGRRDQAETELKKAQLVAPWYAQPYTNSAEVYSILGAPARVIESLETAVARGEPSGAYVLNNPLFRFLRGDARFVKLTSRIEAQQEAIRQALGSMPL